MIPAIFGRGWVHPWRRPAKKKRFVRFSAPPGRAVSPVPKGVGDAVVFGPQHPRGRHSSAPEQYCPCGVSWATGTAAECWNCGRQV